MAINNVTLNTNVQVGTATAVSTAEKESKNLQNQIAGKEQLLSRLSTDSKMTEEEKAKERQELQRQIEELNRKLKQLQLVKEEEAQKAEKEQEQKTQETEQQKTEEENPVDHQEGKTDKEKPLIENLQKMLASDSVVQQNRVQESVARRQEGKIKVLETEIKSDKLHGTDTGDKLKELSALRKEKTFEIEPKEEKKMPERVLDSGTKIVIR